MDKCYKTIIFLLDGYILSYELLYWKVAIHLKIKGTNFITSAVCISLIKPLWKLAEVDGVEPRSWDGTTRRKHKSVKGNLIKKMLKTIVLTVVYGMKGPSTSISAGFH